MVIAGSIVATCLLCIRVNPRATLCAVVGALILIPPPSDWKQVAGYPQIGPQFAMRKFSAALSNGFWGDWNVQPSTMQCHGWIQLQSGGWRVHIDSPLPSISAFSKDLKDLFWDFEADKSFTNPVNSLVSRQSSSLSPSLSPCLSSGNYSLRLFQETIKGFDCKINGRALGAVLWHRLATKSAAVAVGSERLA